ncbi:hypothetical protein Ancab_028220 [Ancistrocladus abbreviatus]
MDESCKKPLGRSVDMSNLQRPHNVEACVTGCPLRTRYATSVVPPSVVQQWLVVLDFHASAVFMCNYASPETILCCCEGSEMKMDSAGTVVRVSTMELLHVYLRGG